MAVLGVGGRLRLRRELPTPATIQPSDLNTTNNSFFLGDQSYWSGDLVSLSGSQGLPLDLSEGAGPDNPDGYATYFGSKWHLGHNRIHIKTDSDPFYQSQNSASFYVTAAVVGLTQTKSYYIYRDQLDRVSLYATRAEALSGSEGRRIRLYDVDFGQLILASHDHVNDDSDWFLQADLRDWSLTLNAPEVDTTSVGEKFGESVKSLVTGGGTMDFFIDRFNYGDQAQDTTALLKLLLMTGKGCKAEAEFWIISHNQDNDCIRLPGDLYYETELMVTQVAVNTRPTEVVAGSLNFVTVGEIALRMGTN